MSPILHSAAGAERQTETENVRPKSRASVWSGYYLVMVLTLLATVSYIDRTILNLLVDPVKRSLLLSDTQISLVQGFGFTSAYLIANPILGRLADRMNRRNLLMAAAVVWSLGTAMGAFAGSVWGLLMCRLVVGASEAVVQPASWSMLSDRYSPNLLPRVMSLFLVAPYFGGGLALIFGGTVVGAAATIVRAAPIVEGLEPWRLVFLIVGLGGTAIAALLLGVREPHRREDRSNNTEGQPSIRAALGYLLDHRSFFGNYYLAMSSIVVLLYAIPAWLPMFASRRGCVKTRCLF